MNTNEDFKAFYKKYLKFSIRIAKKMVKDKDLAEDISHDTFYHLFRKLETIDSADETKLRALVEIATARKARDYLKKKHVKTELFYDTADRLDVVDPCADLEELFLESKVKTL